jgi:hypothetical protein
MVMYARRRGGRLCAHHAAMSAASAASHTNLEHRMTLTLRLPAARIAIVALTTTLGISPAFAEETICNGTIGPVALDNIFVPDGASCVLDRTRANGNLVIGTGAILQASSIRINGSVQAEGAMQVQIGGGSTVGGSVQIVQGHSATLNKLRVSGDILLDSNVGALKATANVVGGNLQVFQNEGGVLLRNNRIDGNLQCKANTPAPRGSGNVATSKEDQCARL